VTPYDQSPFGGDEILRAEIAELIQRYGIHSAIETGTWHGWTTRALASMVEQVWTVEANPDFLEIARANWRDNPPGSAGIASCLGDSRAAIGSFMDHATKPTLYYLDAHWGEHCPLLEELAIIMERDPAPMIVMHDMQVPGHPELKFDTYGVQPLCREWVLPVLKGLKTPWRSWQNDHATGHQVGVLFVAPTNAGGAV
jgi:hypothetical protein